MIESRQIRAENYAAKRANAFKCAECGADDQILVVTEKTTGELTTRCERHLDRRRFDVRPRQFDEAERLRDELEKRR